MTKKYEFTGMTKDFLGITLKQIRALVTISGVVTAGDVGGWVESESNLSQVSGNAWVYGDALVYGNAKVYGDALVYGNAKVYGNALVYGDSSLFWASKVGTENGTLTVFNSQDGTLTVTRGCFIGSVDDFLDKSKRIHDEKTHREYCLLVEVAKSRIVCLDGENK